MTPREVLEGRLNGFKAGLPQLLKSIAQRGAAVYGGEVTGQFDTGYKVEVPSHRPKSKALAISSGRLAQSFLQTPSSYPKSDRVFDITTETAKVKVKFGSNVPYASIQDSGGNIPATPKMARFFMAMWLKTGGGSAAGKLLGDTFWFALWLHAKRGQPIRIPAHHYKRGAEEAAKEHVPIATGELVRKELEKMVNG